MVTKEFSEACKEINEIFKFIGEDKLNEIPQDIRETFNKYESKEYIPHIDISKSLDNQNIKKKTKDILVALYVKYWCEERDKQEVNKILNENYEKTQLELRNKYNPDDIFKKRYNIEDNKEINNVMLVEYKESIFKKIINKINNYFKSRSYRKWAIAFAFL